MTLGQTRIFWVMTGDGLLPQWLARVHKRFRTPYITTIGTGVVLATIAALFPIDVIAELMSIGTLLIFVIVCAMVLVMRHRAPDLPRPFKTPSMPLTPAVGILICFLPYVRFTIRNIVALGRVAAAGIVIYVCYSRKHSRLSTTPL